MCFYMHHRTDRITHTTTFVTPFVEHWLEREMTQWIAIKGQSDDPPHQERTLYHGATSRSQSLKTASVNCISKSHVTIMHMIQNKYVHFTVARSPMGELKKNSFKCVKFLSIFTNSIDMSCQIGHLKNFRNAVEYF